MSKKVCAIAAILLVASIGSIGTARAQDYPPATNSLVASDSTVAPGQQVTFTARTFQPGSTVTFTLFSDPVRLGTATAASNGVATLTAAIPATTAAGSHRVDATGTGATGSPLTVSTALVVSSNGAAPLPTTGSSNTLPLATAGVVALALGGLILLVARRRRGALLSN
jgi:LPXTG-motif cell wall-anchored protein